MADIGELVVFIRDETKILAILFEWNQVLHDLL